MTDESSAGEALDVRERLVLAPGAGCFRAETQEPGGLVLTGQTVGTVEAGVQEDACCSALTGMLMGVLVLDGKPVRAGQPVAWLRT